MKCNNCNKETIESNFCTSCGAKLNKVCKSCWMKRGQPYDCGFEECPGFRLPILEKSITDYHSAFVELVDVSISHRLLTKISLSLNIVSVTCIFICFIEKYYISLGG